VYDNAYALVIGFAPGSRASDAIVSLVVMPRRVSVCFLQGAHLDDPDRILAGGGNLVRHVRLESAATLDRPALRAMFDRAEVYAEPDWEPGAARIEIRAVSPNQRPRRTLP
jgi:hypothetical protein